MTLSLFGAEKVVIDDTNLVERIALMLGITRARKKEWPYAS